MYQKIALKALKRQVSVILFPAKYKDGKQQVLLLL